MIITTLYIYQRRLPAYCEPSLSLERVNYHIKMMSKLRYSRYGSNKYFCLIKHVVVDINYFIKFIWYLFLVTVEVSNVLPLASVILPTILSLVDTGPETPHPLQSHQATDPTVQN